jgi:hypothetical protein
VGSVRVRGREINKGQKKIKEGKRRKRQTRNCKETTGKNKVKLFPCIII